MPSQNWTTIYDKRSNPVLQGRKAKHITEIVIALALLGPSTTTEMQKFIQRTVPDEEYRSEVTAPKPRSLEQIYYKLIHGRLRKKTGRKKSEEKYLGLEDQKLVFKTGSITKKRGNKYFLTLKGCFLALGTHFDGEHTFIKNAAKNYLFFAYVDKVLQETSLPFVKSIFFEPVREKIQKDLIRLENFNYYYHTIQDSIGRSFYFHFNKIMENFAEDQIYNRIEDYPKARNFQRTIMQTFFVSSTENYHWRERMIHYFYPINTEEEFYLSHSDESDPSFLYHTMRVIHYAYYGARGYGIPPKHHNKDPPLPKDLELHLKNKRRIQSINKKVHDELLKRGIEYPTPQEREQVQKELGLKGLMRK